MIISFLSNIWSKTWYSSSYLQEVTLNLDQLHKEEMESVSKQHQDRVSDLRGNIDLLQEKIDALESALHKEEGTKQNMITLDEMDSKMREMRDEHMEECKKIQDDHETQLQQIEEVLAITIFVVIISSTYALVFN